MGLTPLWVPRAQPSLAGSWPNGVRVNLVWGQTELGWVMAGLVVGRLSWIPLWERRAAAP